MADRYAIRVIRVPETGGGVDDGVVFCGVDEIAAFRDLVVNGSPPGPTGAAGASAYAIAVAGGFVGDEAAWLASLIGPKGDAGDPLSVLAAYPVGAIYLSANEKDPNDLFGGKWEQIKWEPNPNKLFAFERKE